MIFEVAELTVDSAHASAFEYAVNEASAFFRAAPGCTSFELQRVIECPDKYRLIVGWKTLEDHTERFRHSEGFKQWRSLVGAYFTAPPQVLHVETVLHKF